MVQWEHIFIDSGRKYKQMFIFFVCLVLKILQLYLLQLYKYFFFS